MTFGVPYVALPVKKEPELIVTLKMHEESAPKN